MPFELVLPKNVALRTCPPDRMQMGLMMPPNAKGALSASLRLSMGDEVAEALGLTEQEDMITASFGTSSDHGRMLIEHINRRESFRIRQHGGGWRASIYPLPSYFIVKRMGKVLVTHVASAGKIPGVIITIPEEFMQKLRMVNK